MHEHEASIQHPQPLVIVRQQVPGNKLRLLAKLSPLVPPQLEPGLDELALQIRPSKLRGWDVLQHVQRAEDLTRAARDVEELRARVGTQPVRGGAEERVRLGGWKDGEAEAADAGVGVGGEEEVSLSGRVRGGMEPWVSWSCVRYLRWV